MARTPTVPMPDVLIHEPARLRILSLLAMIDEADFMYILQQTGLSRGNLSVQLGKLETAGIVALDRRLVDGRARSSYALTAEGKRALREYRELVESLIEPFPK